MRPCCQRSSQGLEQHHFENMTFEDTGAFINEPSDVDLVAIVKNSKHHNMLPGKGPHVIFFVSSAEATKAMKNIKIVVSGSDEDQDSAMRTVKDGADRGQMKPSGQATKDKARKICKQLFINFSVQSFQNMPANYNSYFYTISTITTLGSCTTTILQ